jgi:hypothetical protein
MGEQVDFARFSAALNVMGVRGKRVRGGLGGLGGLDMAGVYLIFRVHFPLRVNGLVNEVYQIASRAIRRDFSIKRWTSTTFAVDFGPMKFTAKSTRMAGRSEGRRRMLAGCWVAPVARGESCKEERVRMGNLEGQKLSCEGGWGAKQVPMSTGRGEFHNQEAGNGN